MPVILIRFPECTAIPVTFGMVNWFLSVPVKFVTSLLAKAPDPSVFVGKQAIIQTHPGAAGYCKILQNEYICTMTNGILNSYFMMFAFDICIFMMYV